MKKALESRVKLINETDPNGPMSLDLRRFHADPAFLGEPVYAGLNRTPVAKELYRIIGESPAAARLQALELSENRLATLDAVAYLAEKAPNVSLLHLSDNNVSPNKKRSHIQGLF